jgi:hypothetical protein
MTSPHAPQQQPPAKERCPIDGHAQFFYVARGLAYRCRHCKQEHVVAWAEILKKYQEMRERDTNGTSKQV